MTYLQTPTDFDQMIEQLEKAIGPDEELDQQIHKFILADWDVLNRLMPVFSTYGTNYTSSLDALALLAPGWWWHLSHLGASVVPNRPEAHIPINNAIDYDRTGNPVEYHSHLWGDERIKVPRAISAAALKAHRGLYLKRKAINDHRMYLTQTGHGPRLIMADGRITHLPYQSWLDEDGNLVSRHVIFTSDPVPNIIEDEDE